MDYTDPGNSRMWVRIYETPPKDDDDKTTLWSGYLRPGQCSPVKEPSEHYHVWVSVKNKLYMEWVYYEGRVVRIEN